MLLFVYQRVSWHIMRRMFCTVSTKRVTVSTILNNERGTMQLQQGSGDEVMLEGWARSVRKMKDTVFIDITDGTSSSNQIHRDLQVTATKALVSAMTTDLTAGCCLRVQGHVTQAPISGQPELQATALTILGPSGSASTGLTIPVLPRKNYSNDYLRQYLHLRHRTTKFAAVAHVRNSATRLLHEFMAAREFVHVHTPILTCNDCEGAGETFQLAKRGGIEFFDKPVYLTVSAQLQLEAVAHGLSRVYTLNPVFRADNSRSRLHLSEFYMMEAEQAFVSDLSGLLRLMEDLVVRLSERMVAIAAKDIALSSDQGVDFSWLTRGGPFPVLEYDEAVNILRAKGVGCAAEAAGGGLSKEQELALVAHCGQVPTFVINWPRTAKPAFYMKESNDGKVLAVDLLAPVVGEMAGGSLREDDYSKLSARCVAPPQHNMDWYMDLRQFGGAPTAGFGLGFERYLQSLCNISNIKDTILFPRWPHNCAM